MGKPEGEGKKISYMVGMRMNGAIHVVTMQEYSAALRAGAPLMSFQVKDRGPESFMVNHVIHLDPLEGDFKESPESMRYRAVSEFSRRFYTPWEEVRELVLNYLNDNQFELDLEDYAKTVQAVLDAVDEHQHLICDYEGKLRCFTNPDHDSFVWLIPGETPPAGYEEYDGI